MRGMAFCDSCWVDPVVPGVRLAACGALGYLLSMVGWTKIIIVPVVIIVATVVVVSGIVITMAIVVTPAVVVIAAVVIVAPVVVLAVLVVLTIAVVIPIPFAGMWPLVVPRGWFGGCWKLCSLRLDLSDGRGVAVE